MFRRTVRFSFAPFLAMQVETEAGRLGSDPVRLTWRLWRKAEAGGLWWHVRAHSESVVCVHGCFARPMSMCSARARASGQRQSLSKPTQVQVQAKHPQRPNQDLSLSQPYSIAQTDHIHRITKPEPELKPAAISEDCAKT